MGTQGTGRKRSTKKEKSTAEDDALNLIAREAEARLAAKRAARAEAREIRMKELERQQKEIFQVQKKYYGLDTKVDDRSDSKWGDIEQWMEDSERYSRSSRIQTLSDDDERMSVGSRGSVRSDLDAVGAYGGGGSSSSLSLKKSKKKKKHKHKDKDRNGYDDDYSVISSRSSRISDESRASRSSRLDLTSSRLSDDSRLSRASRSDLQPASYASSDLYNLNGLSSSRNTGSAFNGYQSSLYEDSLCSASRRVVSSASQPLEYTSYRSSGSRASSRASSARASPVDNCGSVASFLRSAASSSGLPRDLDDVTIPDFSDVEDRDYLEKGSRAASALTAGTLTSLGGSSSRRGSGETAITVDAETSIREIKEIHELKDQIQDVELKYTQNLKEAKDALAEVEEKYRKAMVSNAQLDNEKNNLMYQVDTLKDSLMELEELLSESQRGYEEKVKEFEREKHAHSVLQFQFNEMKETLKQSEELLNDIRQLRLKQDGFIREISDLQETVEWKDKKIAALERQKEYTDAIRIERDELREEVVTLKDILKKHGIVLGPDLNINGDIGVAEVDGSPGADPASQPAPESQTTPTEGNSMLGNTEETQLRSSGEEEVDPEQHQEMFEEAKENLLSSDTVCDVAGVPTLETPNEEQPTEEQQTCLNTEEDSVDGSDLSKDLNVDIKDSSITEAKDVIVCSAGLQAITSSEENAPETETPEGRDLEETSNPELEETGTKSSSVDTHGDDFKESCNNILEEQENKKEAVEESNLRDAESCHQQNVAQDVKKEPIESVPEPEQEPENAEEAENDEAEETSSKSQPQGAAASGKKKRKKRRGKKKGGAQEDKNQHKDETDKGKVKTDKDIEVATRDNGQTTEPAKPDIDGAVNETVEESKTNQVKNEQDRQEIQEKDGAEAVKPTETFSHSETLKESRSDHVTDEHDKEQTLGNVEVEPVTTPESFPHIEIRVDHVTDEQDEEQSLETEAVEAVAPTETFSCVEESKMDLKTDVQEKEQSSETETAEAGQAVTHDENFSDLDTIKEPRTDPQKVEQDEEQNLETEEVEEVESKTSLVSEADLSSPDLNGNSKGAESSDGLYKVCASSVDNSQMETDISTNGDVVHTESEIVDRAEDEVGSVDEMKSECTISGEVNTEAESHVPSNDDDPEEATDTAKNDEEAEAETEQESVPLGHDEDNSEPKLDQIQKEELNRDLMDSEGLAEPDSSSRKEKSCDSESPTENTDEESAIEQDHCAEESAVAEDPKHQNGQNDPSETLIELHGPGKDKSEDNGSSQPILQDSDGEEPDSSSRQEKSRDSESPTENTDAFETEKSLETVARAEQLDDAESQTLQCDDQIDEPQAEVSSETEEIKTVDTLNTSNSSKDESAIEQDHCAEESAVAADPEHQNSQNDQSETLVELHEPSKDKSEDNGSSQPILQDSDEEDGEDDEGQSFDFDDMDIDAATATNPPKSPKQEDIEEGVEVMSDSSGLCQSKTESNENTRDEPVANNDEKCTVDGGNQGDTLDKKTDAVPDEEAVSEKGENVCEKQKSTPEEEVVVADEPVIEVGKVVELGDGAENINQATSLPVEEGLDAINQELQGEDVALPKSAVANDKETPQTKKDAKKNGKKGKAKGKEECKMS